MNKEQAIIHLDIRGLVCPSCLLLSLQEVNANRAALNRRQCMLHILTDHRQATVTIPEALRKMGLAVKVEEGVAGFGIHVFKEG